MNVLCIIKQLYQNNEEPSRPGPGPLALLGDRNLTIGNTIGNSIGNSIKKSGFSRYPFYKYFDYFKNVFLRANAILTGRFIGKTYKEYQNEFVEHFPYGKQIGKFLDRKNTQKRPQAPKPIFLGL